MRRPGLLGAVAPKKRAPFMVYKQIKLLVTRKTKLITEKRFIK
jgi:hypothetical protein